MGSHGTANAAMVAEYRSYLWCDWEVFRKRYPCKVGLTSSLLRCRTTAIQTTKPVPGDIQRIDVAKLQTLAQCHEVIDTLMQLVAEQQREIA